MKKLYTAIVALIFAGTLSAQNAFIIKTPSVNNPDMVTPTNTVVTGDTVEYFNADEFADISGGLFYVINPGIDSSQVKVRRTTLSSVAGTANFFCWNLCFTPTVSLSGIITIQANDTSNVFTPDYQPQGNSGTTFVQYKFFDANDTTQYALVTVKFTSGTVGIENEELAISNVYPNPANNFITFDYTLGNNNGKISITDMTGKVVRTAILPEGSNKHTLNLDGLSEGVYIYTFYGNNKAVSTKKFIINK